MKTCKLIISLLILVTYSCDNTGSTTSKVLVVNNSRHHVKLIPYTDSIIKETSVINLNAGEEHLESEIVERAILGAGGMYTNYAADTDSIIVIFDDSLKTIHFMDTVGVSISSFYTRQSLRSLYNSDSYMTEIKDLSKKERIIKYTYTFTEEDYNYAVTGGK